MDDVVLVILVVIAVPVLVIAWLIARVMEARRNFEQLTRRLEVMELEFSRFRQSSQTIPSAAAVAEPIREAISPVLPVEPVVPFVPIKAPKIPVAEDTSPPVFVPPPPRHFVLAPATPPPSEPETPTPSPEKHVVDWEQFMGVKGLAWIGGFTFFLGVVFAIQYAFAHHFISPAMQAVLGFLAGLGVLAGGVVMSRRNYPALSQTLCATGVLILYSVTFACRAYYHFAFFGPVPTFLLMALVTAVAFTLAVHLDAMVVAILGMLGGFLTPILLSTGQDNPQLLFGYIAILDAGLILVALRRRWLFLTGLGAAGTALMQAGWAKKFFVAGRYFEGNRIFTALGVLLLFNVIYLAASLWAKSRKPAEKLAADIKQWLFGSTLALVTVALAFNGWFLSFQPLAHRPWLMFGFIILLDLVVQSLVLADETLAVAQPAAGMAIFALLAY